MRVSMHVFMAMLANRKNCSYTGTHTHTQRVILINKRRMLLRSSIKHVQKPKPEGPDTSLLRN